MIRGATVCLLALPFVAGAVQIEGVVQHQVNRVSGDIELRVATEGLSYQVRLPAEWNLRCRDYLDKRLRFEGHVEDGSFVVTRPIDFAVTAAAKPPQDFAPITLAEIRRDGVAHLSPYRRWLEGTIRYADDGGRRLVVADEDEESITVMTDFANDCAAGDLCRFTGYLERSVQDRAVLHVVDEDCLAVIVRAEPPTVSGTVLYGLLVIAICLAVIVGILIWVRILRKVIAKQAERLLSSMRDKIRLQAEADERSRLAADLHDGFQQLLAGAMFKLEAGICNLEDVSKARDELVAARKSLANAQNGLRGYVWMMAAETEGPETVSGLFAHAIERLPHWQETVKLRIEGEERPLGRKQYGALLMILLESVGNALFHGQATFVSVKVIFGDTGLLMSVADNGRGFDGTQVSCLSAGGAHMGLKNMHRRAEGLGGTFELAGAPDEGVTVSVRLPYAGGEG